MVVTHISLLITAERASKATTEKNNILFSKSFKICALLGQIRLNSLFQQMLTTDACRRNTRIIHHLTRTHNSEISVSLWPLASSSIFTLLHKHYRDVFK